MGVHQFFAHRWDAHMAALTKLDSGSWDVQDPRHKGNYVSRTHLREMTVLGSGRGRAEAE